ncbi:hypothetical protein F5X97DRAFT_310493 [Nemania serpens]|nr:hypothetical protein F5X97DRAFT_310493 [Nemania serpens]
MAHGRPAQQASQHCLLKRGATECLESLPRSVSQAIISPADCAPLSIILHPPLRCDTIRWRGKTLDV